MKFLRTKCLQVPLCLLTVSAFVFSQTASAQNTSPQRPTAEDDGITGSDVLSRLQTTLDVVDEVAGEKFLGDIRLPPFVHFFEEGTGATVSDATDKIGTAFSVLGPILQWQEANADIEQLTDAFEGVSSSSNLDEVIDGARFYAETVAVLAYGTAYGAREGAKESLIQGGAGAVLGMGLGATIGLVAGKGMGKRMWTYGKTGLIIGLALGAYMGAKEGKAAGAEKARQDVNDIAERLEAALEAEREAFRRRIREAGGVVNPPPPPRTPRSGVPDEEPPLPRRSPRSGVPDGEAAAEQAVPLIAEAELSIEEQIEREELRLDVLIGEQSLSAQMVNEGVALLPGENLQI